MTPITEALIRATTTAESFSRGYRYYRQGAIHNPTRQGNVLSAECEGTSAPYYRVRVELDDAGIRAATCTCPYDWGGYCKHIVALLLTYVHHPEEFAVRSEPADLLADLSREDLVALLLQLLQREPDLYDWLEGAIQVRQVRRQPPRARRTPVDPAPYRRQVERILHGMDRLSSYEAYWQLGSMIGELSSVQQTAQEFLDSGDPHGALTILMVLTEAVTKDYGHFDDSDGDLASFISELGQPLAEAILSADLDAAERREIADKLTALADELQDYGIDDALDVAIAAAVRGWGRSSQRAERVGVEREEWDEDKWDEEEERGEAWGEEQTDWIADDLVEAQLNVLERQGRIEEYLALSQEAGHHLRYALKLLELGRAAEATSHALATLGLADEALELAMRLRDAGQVEAALAVAERGLALSGNKHNLGRWLGPLEEGLGRTAQARAAWLAAFADLPSLENYLTLERLAGADWVNLKPQLMDILHRKAMSEALVDVLLYEGQIDEAIQVAEDKSAWDYRLLEKVVDAAIEARPDWVIQACRRQAEELIERTQSKYYAAAARWLGKMKAAYLVGGREQEWSAYLADLRQRYNRRRALLAELERL